ncbi:hypothetical protein ACVWWN_002013 [Mycobacterium sp. URHB0021]
MCRELPDGHDTIKTKRQGSFWSSTSCSTSSARSSTTTRPYALHTTHPGIRAPRGIHHRRDGIRRALAASLGTPRGARRRHRTRILDESSGPAVLALDRGSLAGRGRYREAHCRVPRRLVAECIAGGPRPRMRHRPPSGLPAEHRQQHPSPVARAATGPTLRPAYRHRSRHHLVDRRLAQAAGPRGVGMASIYVGPSSARHPSVRLDEVPQLVRSLSGRVGTLGVEQHD